MKMYPILNFSQHYEDVWGSREVAPRILNLGTTWRWVVRFAPPPLYPQGVGWTPKPVPTR